MKTIDPYGFTFPCKTEINDFPTAFSFHFSYQDRVTLTRHLLITKTQQPSAVNKRRKKKKDQTEEEMENNILLFFSSQSGSD